MDFNSSVSGTGSIIVFFSMAGSTSKEDEANSAFWLATLAGKMDRLILPARDFPLCPARKDFVSAIMI